MAVRTVTGNVREYDDTPWEDFELRFTVAANQYTYDGHYPVQSTTINAESDGSFSIDLTTGITYVLDLVGAWQVNGRATGYPPGTKDIRFTVPPGDTPISLEEIRGLEEVATWPRALIEQIVQEYIDGLP